MKLKIREILIESLIGKNEIENTEAVVHSMSDDENILETLQMDSLDAFEFYISIQDEFKQKISSEHFDQLYSINAIKNYLSK